MSASGTTAPRLPGWPRAYRRADLAGDVGAGIVVAMMVFPQGMAYALVAGLPHLAEVKGPVLDRVRASTLLSELSGRLFLSTANAWDALARHGT